MIAKDKYFSTITYPNWYWEIVTKIINQTHENIIREIMKTVNDCYDFQDFKLLHQEMTQNFRGKNGND